MCVVRRLVLVLALVLAGVAATQVCPSPARAAPLDAALTQAVDYATAHDLTAGVAAIDRATGQMFTAGQATRLFGAASVVKTIIAARILLAGQMSGATATEAYRMITVSDNRAALDLWQRFGGPAIIGWVASHYGIPDLGTPNSRPGFWGNTHIRATGMAKFYAAVYRDPAVGLWPLNAMHHYSCRADDGGDQCWASRPRPVARP